MGFFRSCVCCTCAEVPPHGKQFQQIVIGEVAAALMGREVRFCALRSSLLRAAFALRISSRCFFMFAMREAIDFSGSVRTFWSSAPDVLSVRLPELAPME